MSLEISIKVKKTDFFFGQKVLEMSRCKLVIVPFKKNFLLIHMIKTSILGKLA